MLIEQIWTGNAYRNFNYLLACPETGEVMAIDPLDYDKCLSKAKEKGWEKLRYSILMNMVTTQVGIMQSLKLQELN